MTHQKANDRVTSAIKCVPGVMAVEEMPSLASFLLLTFCKARLHTRAEK